MKRIQGKGLLLAILCAPLGSGLYAQAWHGNDGFFEDLPVVLTVTGLPQNVRELPASVTIIDRAMIEAAGVVDLADLFRLVPGFQVGYYHGGEGSRVVVTSHGFSDPYSRRMQVMIDGRSVYKAATGGAEWHDLPLLLDDIERIEVIRGPNAVSYGANAMVGVINIITRHPSKQQGNMLSTTIGERGHRQYSLRHSDRTDTMHYRISGDFTSHSGYRDLGDTGTGLADDMLTRGYTFRGDQRSGVNDYLTLQAGGGNGKRQAGKQDSIIDQIRYRNMENQYYQLEWKRLIDSDSDVNVQVYYDKHQIKDRMLVEYEVIPMVYTVNLPIDTSLKSTRQNIYVSNRSRWSDTMRATWGWEWRRDTVTAANHFDLGETYVLESWNTSLNTEWASGNWVINLGNMLEKNKLMGEKNSPRMAVNYLIGDSYYLRGARSVAYRIPTFFEENADLVLRADDGTVVLRQMTSDGDIKPERLDSKELAAGYETRRVGYSIRLFKNHFTNVVNEAYDENSIYTFRLANNGEMTIEGREFQLRALASERIHIHMGYARSRGDGWKVSTYRASGDNEILDLSPTVPKTTVSVLLDTRINATQRIGMAYYRISSMRLVSGSVRNLSEDIEILDVNYSKRFRMGDSHGQWGVIVRDLTGSYFTVRNNVWRDRQAFLNVGFEF